MSTKQRIYGNPNSSLSNIKWDLKDSLFLSKRLISSWIVEVIKTCYALENLNPPKNVHAHGTGAQASSLAAFSRVDPTRICRAAVWLSLHTFCKHYRTHQLWEGRRISTDVLSAAFNDNP